MNILNFYATHYPLLKHSRYGTVTPQRLLLNGYSSTVTERLPGHQRVPGASFVQIQGRGGHAKRGAHYSRYGYRRGE